MTTMDSLEAHVWTTYTGDTNKHTPYHVVSTFVMFKNNTMYTRRYNYIGTWWPVFCEPFYFYTPGIEDRADTVIQWGDTIKLFNFDRIEQTKNGKHIAYNYATNPTQNGKIISPYTTGFASGVISLDIVSLNDSILIIRRNTDFTPKQSQQTHNTTFHATDKPFPWDENLKKYRKLPILESPPELGMPGTFIHL